MFSSQFNITTQLSILKEQLLAVRKSDPELCANESDAEFLKKLDDIFIENLKKSPEVLAAEWKSIQDKINESQKLGQQEKPDIHNLFSGLHRYIQKHALQFSVNSSEHNFDALYLLKLIENLPLTDLNKQDENGDTVLHVAMRTLNSDIVKKLIGKKVDIEVKNKAGETPLATGLNYLSNMVWNDRYYSESIRILIYEANACTQCLDDSTKKMLARYESSNWKPPIQQFNEVSKERKPSNTQNMGDVLNEGEKVNHLLQTKMDTGKKYIVKSQSCYSVAEKVVESIILDKDLDEDIKNSLHELLLQVLDKIVLSHPLIARLLYLHARYVNCELGNTQPHQIVMLPNGDEFNTPSGVSGWYTPTFKTAVAVILGPTTPFVANEDWENYEIIESCKRFLADDKNKPPYFIALMVHELLHQLLDQFYCNNAKIFPSKHLDDKNAKFSLACKEALKNDLEKSNAYTLLHPDNADAKEAHKSINKVLKKYQASDISAELPAFYIYTYLRCKNKSLLEEMFPQTTFLLVHTLNLIYKTYQDKYPVSHIVQPNSSFLLSHQDATLDQQISAALKERKQNSQPKSVVSNKGIFKEKKQTPFGMRPGFLNQPSNRP